MEYALEHGQPVNSILDGVLPLHAACASGNIQVVNVLIGYGADVNAPRLVWSCLPQASSLTIVKGYPQNTPVT